MQIPRLAVTIKVAGASHRAQRAIRLMWPLFSTSACHESMKVFQSYAEYFVTSKAERRRAWALAELGRTLVPDEATCPEPRTEAEKSEGGTQSNHGDRTPQTVKLPSGTATSDSDAAAPSATTVPDHVMLQERGTQDEEESTPALSTTAGKGSKRVT